MKQSILIIIGVLAFIGFIYVINRIPAVEVPGVIHHCSELYDQNDIQICEDDHLQTPGSYDSTVHYGMFEDTEQFYITDEKGDHPLSDWSSQPRETWSVIVK